MINQGLSPCLTGAIRQSPQVKEQAQKPFMHTVYATADTVGSRRLTFNTSSPPPAPTLSDSRNTGPTNGDDHEAVYNSSSTL
jgi:hypothetical protein